MTLLYTFIIHCYALLIRLVALWHPKARTLVQGRLRSLQLLDELPKAKQKRFWFHCASLGEYDMALPLIQACQAADLTLEIVVSFYSPSGMQHYHKRGFEPFAVFYLPADLPRHMNKVVRLVGASRLYLLKYEFWPNMLRAAKKRELGIYSIATLLRPKQVYFRWYGAFFRKALNQVLYFGVQDLQTKKLLLVAGVAADKIELLGDLRFNRVIDAKQNAQANVLIAAFAQKQPLLILGSSWPPEEALLSSYLNFVNFSPPSDLKILIAPHDISSSHLAQLKARFPEAMLYSKSTENALKDAKILILDTIGHLSAAYQYGRLAFIGGGFSGKLHNILEPAAFGLPVMFGPKHSKFPEAAQFLALGFAKELSPTGKLKANLEEFLNSGEPLREKISSGVEQMRVNLPKQIVE